LVVEIKCTDGFSNHHLAQCIDYLRASGKTLCLLVNFQKPTVEWKRVVLNYCDSHVQHAHQTSGDCGSG